MLNQPLPTDMARTLADLIDTALADEWGDHDAQMALLWQATSDPDDLKMAVRRIEHSVEDEFEPMADVGTYLAVAHSVVTRRPPAALSGVSDGLPVRVTVAVDHAGVCGVLRHRNGTTEWFGDVDLPVTKSIQSLLWFEPAA